MRHALRHRTVEAGALRRRTAAPPARPAVVLQRQAAACPCGGGCPRCREGTTVQARLRIPPPDDAFEREADAVAERVLAGDGGLPAIGRLGAPSANLRRSAGAPAAQDEAPQDAGPDGVPLARRIDGLPGGGEPLPQPLRRLFEPRFGRDFAGVRIHTDGAAAALARAVDARAFTVGRDIVFGAGEFRPGTAAGLRLLAHELTHTVQQAEAAGAPQRARGAGAVTPAAYGLRLITPDGERWLGPPKPRLDEEAEPVLLQRTATFVNPTPVRQNPLPRVLAGDTPGLTVPTLNGNPIHSSGDVVRELGTFQVAQTTAAGFTTCQVAPGNTITTSANVTISTRPGTAGWTATVNPATLGGGPRCRTAAIPITMTAVPNNADFERRVAASEQEHVNDLHTLHDRHIIPFDRTVSRLAASGAGPQDCLNNLQAALLPSVQQAAFGLVLGWQASVKTLDDPGGTHQDTGTVTFAADCSSATVSVAQTNPTVPGAAPGNVRPVAPVVTGLNPATLSVRGNDLVQRLEGPPAQGQPPPSAVVRSFASNANATQALRIIQHYGMTQRNVIGAMEYYLVNGRAPSGTMTGANELPIHPDLYQVSVDVPNPGDWAITQVIGNNIQVLVNFGAARDEAYSAVAELRRLRFTVMGWVGASRQTADMRYFRV